MFLLLPTESAAFIRPRSLYRRVDRFASNSSTKADIWLGQSQARPEIATTPGLLATAIPIDRSEIGLPNGVQIVGSYLEDRTTIAFAELMEREFGGFVPPPGYAG